MVSSILSIVDILSPSLEGSPVNTSNPPLAGDVAVTLYICVVVGRVKLASTKPDEFVTFESSITPPDK